MAIRRQIDPEKKVLRTSMSGRVTLEELHEHLAAVQAMNGAAMRELIDTRGATQAFSARDLPKLAEYGRKLFAGGPMAPRAVVVSSVIHFGIARLFAPLAAPWMKVSVFDDIAAAEAWIEMTILAET